MKPIAYHMAAHARPGMRPFEDRNACVLLWKKLRSFAAVVDACVIMPDHIHLIAPVPIPIAIPLRAWSREFLPGRRVWNPVNPAEELTDVEKFRRSIRYVHLNPCRAGLVGDPLEWEWSTHRDAVGAASPSWIDRTRIARVMGTSLSRFVPVFHRYVSSDPTVNVAGTPPPQNLSLLPMPSQLIQASASALRLPYPGFRDHSRARSLAAQLGSGLLSSTILRECLGYSVSGLRDAKHVKFSEEDRTAARLILGDPRFLRSQTPFFANSRRNTATDSELRVEHSP